MQCDESKKDWERCHNDTQIHQSSALAVEISSSTACMAKVVGYGIDKIMGLHASLQTLFFELTCPTVA